MAGEKEFRRKMHIRMRKQLQLKDKDKDKGMDDVLSRLLKIDEL